MDQIFGDRLRLLRKRKGMTQSDLADRLGVSKSESLGRDDILMLEPPSKEHMQHLLSLVTACGVEGQIGG